MEVLLFRVGDSPYLAPLASVSEVLMPATLRPVPGAPPLLLGLLNLRGTAMPVIDLRERLGLSPREGFSRGSRILRVATHHEGSAGADVGIAVDAVLRIAVLEATARQASTLGVGDGHRGRGPLWLVDGELIQEIRLQQLLDAQALCVLGWTADAAQTDFNRLLEQPAEPAEHRRADAGDSA
jgi:purine-binding chemotaxis protein CheW